jgi:hypothetical protein
MPRFRKKPVVIEAFQFTGDEGQPLWFRDALIDGKVKVFPTYVLIETLEGVHRGDLKDWIIKGVKGELYPCKPDIFEATYNEVKDND